MRRIATNSINLKPVEMQLQLFLPLLVTFVLGPISAQRAAAPAEVDDKFILVGDFAFGQLAGNHIYKLDAQAETVDRLDITLFLYGIYDFEYDQQTGRIYWSDVFGGSIGSELLDGNEPRIVVANTTVYGLAIDQTNRRLYYSVMDEGIIRIVPLGGGPSVDIVHDPGTEIRDIVLDYTSKQLLWASKGEEPSQTAIKRSDLDGTNIQVVASGNMDLPTGLAVDKNDICWCDHDAAKVECTGRDGSNRRVMAEGIVTVSDIEMTASHIYICAFNNKKLLRLDRETLEMEELGFAEFIQPSALYLPKATPEPPTEPPTQSCGACPEQCANLAESGLDVKPTFTEGCSLALKQCIDDRCFCVSAKTGKRTRKNVEVPLGETYNCQHKIRRCLLSRFKSLLQQQESGETLDYVPTCSKIGNYEKKQCNVSGECWCVKRATGKEKKNTRTKGPLTC